MVVIIIMTVVTYLAAARTLRVKKLEAGEAVPKFQEESDRIGRRAEAWSWEPAWVPKQLVSSLCKQLSCLPRALITTSPQSVPQITSPRTRCGSRSAVPGTAPLPPPASWSWAWGQAEHAPNRWAVGWKVRDPVPEVRRSPGSVWPPRR